LTKIYKEILYIMEVTCNLATSVIVHAYKRTHLNNTAVSECVVS